MLDIEPDDVALLTDKDFRTLIAKLCEAEVRARGLSASSVRWSGHQDAKDGGIDVNVSLPAGTPIDGFVPRASTGFQVKRTPMGPSKIKTEMRPGGKLRKSIRDLAKRSGAYIIASAESNSADPEYKRRLGAMKWSVRDAAGRKSLGLDFYDRTRISTWLEEHPPLIPWFRRKVNKPLTGWYSYDAWSKPGDSPDEPYLIDEEARLFNGLRQRSNKLEVSAGIEAMRIRLRSPRTALRLVGLSGVGKTRLVQALFDSRVATAESALSPSLALYTNVMDSPDPEPIAMAEELVAKGARTVLVVDNCAAELHSRLSDVCRGSDSKISLITIEYDIQDDQAEGTDVFTLEGSSRRLIEALLRSRHPKISPDQLATIAAASEGNARVALALAGTILPGEFNTILSDQTLFKRLFHQRQDHSETLYRAALALSLVYSYQGEDVSGGVTCELKGIGALVGQPASNMYDASAVLAARDLVQRRGVMRALLPHAIANRLAVEALQRFPFAAIKQNLLSDSTPRLSKSLSRRIGFLRHSAEAREFVSGLLRDGERLANLSDLDDLGFEMLNNVALVAPSAVISAIEKALEGVDQDKIRRFRRYLWMIRALAWGRELFKRCTALMTKIESASISKSGGFQEQVESMFSSLFTAYLSGTHAPLADRLEVIEPLIRSDNAKARELGISALAAALEAIHFVGTYGFDLGGQSQDRGYEPKTSTEIAAWYEGAVAFAVDLAISNESFAAEMKQTLASKFRGIWRVPQLQAVLREAFTKIASSEQWPGGWAAVRETIFFDSKGMPPRVQRRLVSLERKLRPKSAVDEVHTYVLQRNVTLVGIRGLNDDPSAITEVMKQVDDEAARLGQAVDDEELKALLPQLLKSQTDQVWSFGLSVGRHCVNPDKIWEAIRATPRSAISPNFSFIRSFVLGLDQVNRTLASDILDQVLESKELSDWFVGLQSAVGIDAAGIRRLVTALDRGLVAIQNFYSLMSGGVTHKIPGDEFNELLTKIARHPGGVDIAIDILSMRISFAGPDEPSSIEQIVSIGCQLFSELGFEKKRDVGEDYRLTIVSRKCLLGPRGAEATRLACRRLKQAIKDGKTYPFYQESVLAALLNVQPDAVLLELCGDNDSDLKFGLEILDAAGNAGRMVFDRIPRLKLFEWCDRLPQSRYPAVAARITAFQSSGAPAKLDWTQIARDLILRGPDAIAVLRALIGQFSPHSRSGSLASAVEPHIELLKEFTEHSNPTLASFAVSELGRLRNAVLEVRQSERKIEIVQEETFE